MLKKDLLNCHQVSIYKTFFGIIYTAIGALPPALTPVMLQGVKNVL
jgi:hypothetical protein